MIHEGEYKKDLILMKGEIGFAEPNPMATTAGRRNLSIVSGF